MLLVALTGGIGSGKSTVAELLGQRGAVVVDADGGARGRRAGPAGARRAGRALRRRHPAARRSPRPARPAAIAFADDERRQALDGITQPAIGEEFGAGSTRRRPTPIVVCDVPLLVESGPGSEREYEAVIVVEAPLDVRLDRLEDRGVATRRRRAPHGRPGHRRGAPRVATHVVDNGGDLDALARQVDDVWADLERLRAAHRREVTVTPRRYHRRDAARSSSSPILSPAGRPARGDRRARGRGSSGATASRRCSASPARASRSRSPA